MEQFFQFRLNTNNLQKFSVSQNTQQNYDTKNLQQVPKPTDNREISGDNFQNSAKKDNKKKIIILASIAITTLLLAFGTKSGKFKKLFDKISGNVQGSMDKISPAQTIQPEKTIKTELEQPKITFHNTKEPEIKPQNPVPQGNNPTITVQQVNQRTQTPKNPSVKQKRVIHKKSEPMAEKPQTAFNIEKPKKQPKTDTPQGDTPVITVQRINAGNPRISMHDFCTIDSIMKRNGGNPTAQDLKEIENVFKMSTDINLYCPEPRRFQEFTPFFSTMLATRKYINLDPEIKHIIIGHGIGSSIAHNWQFEGTHEKVFDFIERNIPKGEKVLVVTCETAQKVKPGLGTPVTTNLYVPEKPGKIVESGIKRIIGTYTVNKPKIQYF